LVTFCLKHVLIWLPVTGRGSVQLSLIEHTAPRVRADQVTIEEYRANPTKYTFPITEGPKPEVGSAVVYKVPVDQPAGEIQVEVFTPTDHAKEAGKLKTAAGLPAHVDYHGGKVNLSR